MLCKSCSREIPANSCFCCFCGIKVEELICSRCASILPRGSMFCNMCGANLSMVFEPEQVLMQTIQEETESDFKYVYCVTKCSESSEKVWVPSEINRATGIEIAKYKGHMEKVQIPSEINGMPVVKIGKEAFMGSRIVSVHIPDGVTEIDVFAFANCTRLVNVTIPTGMMKIWSFAFNGCCSLPDVLREQIIQFDHSSVFDANSNMDIESSHDEISREAFWDTDTEIDYGYYENYYSED